jgi:DNA-binding transcriptional regulator YdaS (Cro superfamily)
MNKSIIAACEYLGSQSALAKVVQVKPPVVSQWINCLRPVPIEKCVAIEQATNGEVTRKDLRPDDWERIWPELSEKEGV